MAVNRPANRPAHICAEVPAAGAERP